MDETTLKAIIGVVGVIGGALIGGFIAAYNAKQKLKEIQINHSHQLHETYLNNAREYTNSVYVPLSMAITNLSREYLKFRKTIIDGTSEERSEILIKNQIAKFIESIDDLLSRGAGAFLTTELENVLLTFRSFLEESHSNGQLSRRVVVSYGIKLFGISQEVTKPLKLYDKKAEFWQGNFGFSKYGVSMKFKGDQILAAPLASEAFEEKFMEETNLLNLLIKEVTLGSHAISKKA